LIEPAVGDVSYDDFMQRKRLIEAGETAARASIGAIRRTIGLKARRVAVGP
jgi:hypothetical protein